MLEDTSCLERTMTCENFSNSSTNMKYASADMAISILIYSTFPVALLLNGVAGFVSLHLRSTSTFIVYLKNLVASDLLMTLTLPLLAARKFPGATVGTRMFACRYSDVVFYTSLYTSIALMGLISLDRFFKIVRPCGKAIGQNLTFSLVSSIVVWLVLFGGTAIPTMVLTNQSPNHYVKDLCMSMKGPTALSFHKYVVFFMELLFWLILVLIVFCYICITVKVLRSFRTSGSNNSQGKKKTKLRVFSVLLVFFVCFVPLHVTRVPFAQEEVETDKGCSSLWLYVVHNFVLWLTTINACLDPFLYIYLCKEYKEKLLHIVRANGICRNW